MMSRYYKKGSINGREISQDLKITLTGYMLFKVKVIGERWRRPRFNNGHRLLSDDDRDDDDNDVCEVQN